MGNLKGRKKTGQDISCKGKKAAVFHTSNVNFGCKTKAPVMFLHTNTAYDIAVT